MCEVDVAERKRPRQKRIVSGIKLPRDPVRPHPVEIVLNDLRIDEATRMKHHARANQLNRLLDLRGLGKLPHAREELERIDESAGPRRAAKQIAPGKP